MSTLKIINDQSTRRAFGDRSFSKVTLAINAASAATVKTTGAAIVSVDGVFASVAALAAQSIAITHGMNGSAVGTGPAAYVQPISTTVYYVVALSLAGVVAVVQGGYAGQVVTLPQGVSFTSAGEMPAVPVGYAPIGYIKVVTNGATTFTPATTALDAAGLTVTYVDVSVLPAAI